MKEDKQHICDLLLPALQATRNLSDLVSLKYEKIGVPERYEFAGMELEFHDMEVVRATFESGYSKEANVTMDSGTAMIKDILNQIL